MESRLKELNDALDSGAFIQARHMLNHTLKPAHTAHLLESSPPREREVLWNLVNPELEGEVLQHLNDEIQAEFVNQMNTDELLQATVNLDTDDFADILQQLPKKVMQEVLDRLGQQDRDRLEQVLSYPEDTAGGLMNTDVVSIRPDLTVDAVLRYLRRHDRMPEMTDNLFVVTRKDRYIGLLPVTSMLVSDPHTLVTDIMDTEREAIPADLDEMDVANLFERHDWVSAPVVNEEGRLLGRITIDDVVDVIREDADHSLMRMAGLDDDEDTFAPVLKTSKRRAVWLGINLLTALFASMMIGLFQDTIEKVVALAILMPIVASMGGIAGSQALTLVIRGQALGHVERSNIGYLINREVIVGTINGILWALVVASIASWWFADLTIGLIIAIAMIINLVVAAICGTSLPIILKAINIDPALAGGVILTTITDVVGFCAFLGLATLFYA
ncbi:MAG: magnesium transporter [Oceanospirillaceae bacterium]|jgi:magnesium transporter|nr:magnesium transporter [Oceanospirillaceae bacterium]MBT4443214.1 magnesium transporter [Oceanospirillaceae bacterium]MBT6076553.1 magnesium transporter [Oceanospirillaceae bacterium]